MAKRTTGNETFSEADFAKSSFSYPPPHTQTCVEVAIGDCEVAVRDSKDPNKAQLRFTREEWRAFLKGVGNGEFSI